MLFARAGNDGKVIVITNKIAASRIRFMLEISCIDKWMCPLTQVFLLGVLNRDSPYMDSSGVCKQSVFRARGFDLLVICSVPLRHDGAERLVVARRRPEAVDQYGPFTDGFTVAETSPEEEARTG